MKFNKESRKKISNSPSTMYRWNTMEPHKEQVKYSRTKVQEINS